MTLVALSRERSWEFLAVMTEAWNWIQQRPRFYRQAGAQMTFYEFLQFSKAPNKKQIAVIANDRMAALVTVWLMTDDVFDVHVIAPPKSKADVLTNALLAVRNSIFDDLDASVIRTSCGTYRGHKNKGIERILIACGMTPTGDPWKAEGDNDSTFQEYEITREKYAESKTSADQ